MNCIFLDCDGVLNSTHGWLRDKPNTWKYLTPECVEQLRQLLNALPDIKIVISSTWRKMMLINEFREMFNSFNLPGDRIIGYTKIRLSDRARGYEIQEYLDEHPEIEKFVIIDDDADMAHLLSHLVQTDATKGLTQEDVLEVAKRFK